MLDNTVFLIFQAREIALNHVFDSKIWMGYSDSAISLTRFPININWLPKSWFYAKGLCSFRRTVLIFIVLMLKILINLLTVSINWCFSNVVTFGMLNIYIHKGIISYRDTYICISFQTIYWYIEKIDNLQCCSLKLTRAKPWTHSKDTWIYSLRSETTLVNRHCEY